MRKTVLGIITMITLGVSSASAILTANQPTAHAASWHKGTPKTFRGNWQHGSTNGYKPTWEMFKITTGSLTFQGHGMPQVRLKSVKYKKLTHYTYKITGIGIPSGNYMGGHDSFTLTKSHGYLYAYHQKYHRIK